MGLFRHRHLSLGCGCFLAFLFISYYLPVYLKISILALAGAALALVAVVYYCKRSDGALRIVVKAAAPCTLIMLAMVVSLISFGNSRLTEYCDGNLHSVNATVTDVNYQSSYISSYSLNVHRVGENDVNESVNLTVYGSELVYGDVIEAQCYFSEIKSDPLGFDERSYNLSKGIRVSLTASDYTVTAHKNSAVRSLFDKASSYLDKRLATIKDKNTYSMLSALFLGNKSQLDDSVKRDFTRIGLSHVLALSGMHITIVTTVLGFALEKTGLSRTLRRLLLISATLFFVGMTGFSDSALRAGVMVSLAYLLSFFGNRLDTIASLFLSVTIICIIKPFSIFSVSLILSFFAMLGCVISSKFAHRVKLFKKIRGKLPRYLLLNLITSSFAIIFTLPVLYTTFGNVAVLSVFTNLLISPIFTLLLYLCPIYIVLSYFPYVGEFLAWLLEQITSFLIFIGEKCASIHNIVVPINNYAQIIGIGIIVLFLVGFIVFRKRLIPVMLGGILCGAIVFSVGTGILYSERSNNIYVGAASLGTGEAVFIEDGNELSIFDMNADYSLSYYLSLHLGYYEIENYIVTDYTTRTYSTIKNVCNNLIVENIFVPPPVDKDEQYELEKIEALASGKGISVSILENELKTKESCATVSTELLSRSAKRAVTISITAASSTFTYLGGATFEIGSYLAAEAVYTSDIVVFGSYGPKFKALYEYEAPYLDYCLFLNGSSDYATDEFKKSVQDKLLPDSDYPYRFKLTP